jgi:hypothetical protein
MAYAGHRPMRQRRARISLFDLLWLNRATHDEGLRLAHMVKSGEVTRAQVEADLERYGDAEPAIALQYLDTWGIRE